MYIVGANGVMVVIVRNGHGDSSSNPGEAISISHSANILGKSMNYSYSRYEWIVGQNGLVNLGMVKVLEKERFEFKQIKVCLKIDFVSLVRRGSKYIHVGASLST